MEVRLTLDPSKDTFTGEVEIDLVLDKPRQTLWLDGSDLDVKEAHVAVGSRQVPSRVRAVGTDFLAFDLAEPLGPGPAKLIAAYQGKVDAVQTQGIYRQDEAGPSGGDRGYIYTMFEPSSARRAFPCFDEPGYKIPWRLHLRVRAGHSAFANTPATGEEQSTDGWKIVHFADTRPLPSYLVAFVVGPFDTVTGPPAGNHATPLRFLVPRGRGPETRYAAEVTPRIVKALEDYLTVPYPYGKLDVAVVPRSWGGMEHPGLLAMGQPLTLIAPGEQSLQRRMDYTNTTAHELGHYWFGDLVTAASWDEIWLNEGLDTWLEQKITDRLEPSWKWPVYVLSTKETAMRLDASSLARPIRRTIASTNDVMGFIGDLITYYKGAAVTRMIEHGMGEAVFQRALVRYLTDHADASGTTDGFLAALGVEDGGVGAAAMRTFLDQPGLPELHAARTCDGGRARVVLTQQPFVPVGVPAPSSRSWKFPVCLKYPSGADTKSRCTWVGDTAAIDLDTCPPWVLLDEGAAGYYRARYDKAELARLFSVKGALSEIERGSVVSDLDAASQSNALPLDDVLDLLPAVVADGSRASVESVTSLLQGIATDDLPPAEQKAFARLVRRLFGARTRALGLDAKPGDSDDDRVVRPELIDLVGRMGADPDLRAQAKARAWAWLKGGAAPQPEVRRAVLSVALAAGDASLFEALHAQVKRETDQAVLDDLRTAMATYEEGGRRPFLELLAQGDFQMRDATPAFVGLMNEIGWSNAAFRFFATHPEVLPPGRSDDAMFFLKLDTFCDASVMALADQKLRVAAKKMEGGETALDEGLARARECVARNAAQRAALERFLAARR
jgi:aminopeptidase N